MKLTALLLCGALLSLIVAAFLLSRQTRLVRQANEQEVVYSELQRNTQAVLSLISTAETGQRGYLLTGKTRYLAPYRAALERLPMVLGELDRAGFANSPLAAHFTDMRRQVDLKLGELAESLRLYDSGQKAAALALVQTDVGEAYIERLRADVNLITSDLRARQDALHVRLGAGNAGIARLAAVAVSVLVVTVLLFAIQLAMLSRAQAQDAADLAASEQRHRAIVEEQMECIALSTADGTLSYINPACAALFHLSAIDLRGRSLYDGIAPEDQADMRGVIAGVLRTGKSATSQSRTRVPGEPQRWLSWRHILQPQPDGTRCIHSVGRDITESKALEQRLQSSERFLRTITDNVPVRLGYFDRERRLQFVNKVVCDRFGKTPEDFVGRRLEEVIPGGDDRPIARRLPAALAGERQRFEHKDTIAGEERQIESELIPDRHADGEVRGAIGIGVDVTHRALIERALRELTEILDNTPDYILQTDVDGYILYLNPAGRRAAGLSPEAPLRRHITELFRLDRPERWENEIVPVVNRDGAWVGETAVRLPGGKSIPMNHMVIAHRDQQGQITRYSSILRDISADVRARQELAKQTATVKAVVESMPALVAVWDLDLRYRLVNSTLERWRNIPREQLVGQRLEDVAGPEEFQRRLPAVRRALAGETVVDEHQYDKPNDGLRHLATTYIPFRLEDGTIGGLIGISNDITEQRQERQRLQSLSARDPLTGLLNRSGLEAYLDAKVTHGEAAGLAALYIDLDHFKPVNDLYGHVAGDAVLQEFADRLATLVRPTDAVARLGGDEFGIVLAAVRDPEHAARVAEKVVQMAREPILIAGGEFCITISASVGVAFAATAPGGWKNLLARADKMVYEAKGAGRGRRCVEPVELSLAPGKPLSSR